MRATNQITSIDKKGWSRVSGKISFVKTPEELAAIGSAYNGRFYQQEKLQITWEIPESVYRKILPPGLDPVAPIAIAYVSNFMRPQNFYPYTEGALFVLAGFNGEIGCYCLAMPLDGSDQALDAGRVTLGYPKKAARVKLARRGDMIEGWIERNDVRILDVKAHAGQYNHPDLGSIWIGEKPDPTVFDDCVYLLDYDLESIRDRVRQPLDIFQNIKLVRQSNKVTIHKSEPCFVDEFRMGLSEDDPWAELLPERIIGAEYDCYETDMFGCRLLKSYDSDEDRTAVFPYLFARWDTVLFGKYHASYKSGNFYR